MNQRVDAANAAGASCRVVDANYLSPKAQVRADSFGWGSLRDRADRSW